VTVNKFRDEDKHLSGATFEKVQSLTQIGALVLCTPVHVVAGIYKEFIV
jgi:hypothetical protein